VSEKFHHCLPSLHLISHIHSQQQADTGINRIFGAITACAKHHCRPANWLCLHRRNISIVYG